MATEPNSVDVDVENLYREESFTDLQAANIKRLAPVDENGDPDPARSAQYIGDTTLMTQMGPIPVQFPLEAGSLKEAFEKFPQGVQDAIVKLQERAQEMAREEASRIVVPGGGGPGPVGGAGPGGKLVLD
ncbi:MAG: hypothetical protein VCB59_12105 [Gammaproteobacteria bacterium]|jgi:hypothetical protein